jgi:hypothetical protein
MSHLNLRRRLKIHRRQHRQLEKLSLILYRRHRCNRLNQIERLLFHRHRQYRFHPIQYL